MELLLETVLAMLAAIGVWSIGRLLYDYIMHDGSVCALVCAKDDAIGLERLVYWLLHRTKKEKILLIDCGLSEAGNMKIQRLLERNGRLLFYPQTKTEFLAKEAEIWTKLDSAAK